MKDRPSDIDNSFLDNETKKEVTERIMATLAKKKKEARKEPEPVKKAKKTVGTQDLASKKEKAKPEKTVKPRPSADIGNGFLDDETKKEVTKRIIATLSKKKQEVTEFAVKTEKPKIKDPRKIRALIKAIKKGKFEKVKCLVEEGADINQADKNGWSPLTLAIMYGRIEIIKFLIDKGADVNTDNHGWTPLTLAVRNGMIEIIELLIDKGADVNQANKDKYGELPLSRAVRNGMIEIVELLIDKGADVNRADRIIGKMPLGWAIMYGRIEIIELLLEKGADVNQADRNGELPLRGAIRNGKTEITKLLLEKGAKPSSEDLDAARQFGYKVIIQLLEAKMSGAEVMGAMESVLDRKPQKQEQTVAKRAIPLEPESFARLHKGRSPIREVPSDATPPKETADQSIELGFGSLEQGHIQSAEDHFQRALELEPGNITALTNLGFVLCKQGRYESAEVPLTEALKLCSDAKESAIISKNLAIALFKQNKIQGAEDQVKAILKINPNDADAQNLEAIITEKRKAEEGRFQAATRKQIKAATKPEKPEETSSAEGRFQAPTRKQIKPAVKPEIPAVPPSGTQPAEKSIPVSSGDQFFGLPKPDEAPEKPIMEEITSADKAIALAKSSFEEEDYESSIKYLKKAIKINQYNKLPHNNELPHSNLVLVYEMLASREKEEKNKNIYLEKAKKHKEKADKLKAAAKELADKAPTNGQIDELFRPFESSPFDHPPQFQPSAPQPQPAEQASDVQPGLRGQERGDTKEELDSSKKRLKYLCKVILDKPPSYTGWQKAVEGYLALISHKTNLYIKSVNHRAVAIKLRKAYEKGHLADYQTAIIAHTQDVLINKGDFRARVETGLTYLEANKLKEAIKLFKEALSLNPDPTGDYDWVKDRLKELKAKMLILSAPEAKQEEEFECPPTVKQDSFQLQPGEERVKIESLPESQVPKPVPAVPPASTSFPPPRPPFTDAEFITGQLRESDKILKEHEQEQGRPPFVPTLPSMKKVQQIAEDERKLKLTEVQEQFTAGSRTFASIVVDFTEISSEEIDELNKWVKKYTKLLLENLKTHFPHNATLGHLNSLQERGWVSNEAMMGFMEALKKHEELKKAK